MVCSHWTLGVFGVMSRVTLRPQAIPFHKSLCSTPATVTRHTARVSMFCVCVDWVRCSVVNWIMFINRNLFILMKECFKMPQSCGVLGGKPNLAYYFIGYIGEYCLWAIRYITLNKAYINMGDKLKEKLVTGHVVMWGHYNVAPERRVSDVLFHCSRYRSKNGLTFLPTFTLPRWWADLSGPSHHPVSRGLGDGPQGGWPELPLPEESSSHEDQQLGPFCSPGEDQTHVIRLIIHFKSKKLSWSMNHSSHLL